MPTTKVFPMMPHPLFDDNISEELAPYNLKGMKAFTPAYLSGFYADTSDVDAKVYQGDAEYTASAETTERIASDGTFADFTMDTIRPEQLHTKNRNHRQYHVSGMVSILPPKRPCRLCNGQRTDRTGRCGYSD